MPTPTIKSRPVYGTLAPDPTGRNHVVVGEGAGSAALLRLLTDPAFPKDACHVLYAPASGSGTADPALLAARPGVEVLPDGEALLERLRAVLADCRMGTRLYAAGAESFVGSAMTLAATFGMRADERQGEHAGSAARRVRCTHCLHMSLDVTTNLVTCGGCGRTLLVRDHYSQRLAAFMGVQVDAEAPGETPDVQEVFP